jgi:hypothetical protein
MAPNPVQTSGSSLAAFKPPGSDTEPSVLGILQGHAMKDATRIVMGSLLLALAMLNAGCVVAPSEGYYDRDHHRYYHEHTWVACGDHDDHCR